MGKTKILVSSTNLDLLKEFGKDPCAICARMGKNANLLWWLLAVRAQKM